MSHLRLTFLIAAALLETGFPAARAHAQNPAVGKIDEELTLKVPFIIRNVSPEIVSVSMSCVVFGSTGGAGQLSAQSTVSAPRSGLGTVGPGTIAGVFETRHVFQRSGNPSGTKGSILCYLWGSTPAGPSTKFSAQPATPAKFRVAGPFIVNMTTRKDLLYHEFQW